MKPPKLIWTITALIGGLFLPLFAGASPWDQPASKLASKIADILGPGQAYLAIQNLSSLPADDVPQIRNLLVEDLKARGIALAGPDSANAIHVTFSQNSRSRLWVAQIVQGTDSRVAIVDLGPVTPQPKSPVQALVLRKQFVLASKDPIVAALVMGNELITLGPQQLAFYAPAGDGWLEQQRIAVDTRGPLPRDPRGVLAINGSDVEAWLPGTRCAVSASAGLIAPSWNVNCHSGDDPWVIASTPSLRAFYNASRNYFTGVLVPDSVAALPPFYSIATFQGSGGSSMLVGGIDGKVQILSNGSLQIVSGTRDWGSDFAALQSGCGAGTQVIASGPGDAFNDSLRAYELQADVAQPASESLDINGAVTALMPVPDGKSVIAVIHNQNAYEVDRVTALCN